MTNLNKQQSTIVNAPINGAYRVMAGPGSGKTHTLSYRVAYMIQHGVQPSSMLCVTFSKTMAQELIKRITTITPSALESHISTIHALAYRILKEEGEQRKVAADKEVYKITKYAKMALDVYGISEIGNKDFLNYISGAKAHAIRHVDLEKSYKYKIEQNGGIKGDVSWKNDAHKLIASAHIEFDRLMRQDNLLTFDDMLYELELSFEDHHDILRKYQNRFKYILVDEAQDTQAQAMRILVLLAKPENNFTVVGDVDQSIFEFNGSHPEDNMLDGFERRFPKHETYKLEINYRSSKRIIDFTNKAISENYTDDTMKYRKYIQPKEDAEDGLDVTYRVYNHTTDEAEAISKEIEDGIWDNGHNFGDYYVCARTRAQLPYMYRYLFAAKVPFVDMTGGSFWDLGHVQDVIAYLRLSADKMDSDAFIRVYNKASIRMRQPFDLYDKKTNKLLRARGAYVNHRWLGKAFLEAADGSWDGIYNSEAMSYKFRDGVSDIQEFMRSLDSIKEVSQKVQYIIDNCVFRWWLMEEGGADGGAFDAAKSDDFSTLIDLARGFDSTEMFLSYVNDVTSKIRESKNSGNDDVVILSTIHRLKGLERPIVFVMGVMEGLLPHRSINGFKTDGILPLNSKTRVESERRLFFVACSRAKEELHLTGSFEYQGRTMQKSRFAYETSIAEELIAEYVDNLPEGDNLNE